MKLTIIGTGYVGLTTGVALAKKGHFINFIDTNKEKINKINKGISPFFEVGINDSLKEISNNYKASIDKSIYNEENIFFVSVPTPEEEDGSTNLFYINLVLEDISQFRKTKDKFLLVIKSTVPIGTNKKIQDMMYKTKINGEVASNPEFLSQGSALWDSLNPNRIVIGTQSKWAKDILEDIYADFKAPIVNMSLESAELVKYASNSFQAMKVSFINEMANIAEAGSANIKDVSRAMGYDPVIGNKFLRSGIGYGGSCFPKDTKSLSEQAKKLGVDSFIVDSIIKTNINQMKIFTKKALKEKGNFGILGLTFKPGTDDTREAPSHYIIEELNKNGIVPFVYDPKGIKVYTKMFPNDKFKIMKSSIDLIKKTDNILLVTEWEEFKNLKEKQFSNKKVFDGRRIYDWAYYQIGLGYNK